MATPTSWTTAPLRLQEPWFTQQKPGSLASQLSQDTGLTHPSLSLLLTPAEGLRPTFLRAREQSWK